MKTKEERRKYNKEWMAKKRAEDPDFRARQLSSNKKWHKTSYPKNRDKKITYQKDYYKNNKEKVKKRSRSAHLMKKYNLTPEQYLELVVSQNNLCAICGNPEYKKTPSGDAQPLCVDHNHTTNQVRALLCNDCNALLGFAKENKETLSNAINYLKKFN